MVDKKATESTQATNKIPESQVARTVAFRSFGSRIIRGFYNPLTGLVATIFFILTFSFSLYFWPEQGNKFLVLQIILTLLCFYLIIVVRQHVKTRLFAPLTDLREWARSMRDGNLSARIPEPEYSELSALVTDINNLGDSLRSLSREMDDRVNNQTITLQRKTRSLEILYDVAARSNSAKNLDELLIAFLNTLTEIVYAHAGTVRLLSDDNQMRLVGSVGIEEDIAESIQFVPIEHCICAQEFSKNMILCENHFEQCQNCIGEKLFEGDKLENIAIPLRYQNTTLGIYNLFVEKLGLSEREDIKDILTNIGQHLSMAIEKSRWDEESKRVSIMQERTMLAHELHDSLAQTLASLRFRVNMLQKTLKQPEKTNNTDAQNELEQIRTGLDEANFELRELLEHFRIRMDERGLVPATEDLINRFRSESHIQVFFQNECSNLKLAPMLEVHLLHIIQEALTNIRKHSDAKNVRILMRCGDDVLFHVLIEDDGMGIEHDLGDSRPGEHVGITIMKERANRIGAKLTIESDSGEGTRVELELQDANVQGELTIH